MKLHEIKLLDDPILAGNTFADAARANLATKLVNDVRGDLGRLDPRRDVIAGGGRAAADNCEGYCDRERPDKGSGANAASYMRFCHAGCGPGFYGEIVGYVNHITRTSTHY